LRLKSRLPLRVSRRKWRQFIEEAEIIWHLESGLLQNVTTTAEITTVLQNLIGLSARRAEQETEEMIRHFEYNLRRAA
jgi:hypothetical protein